MPHFTYIKPKKPKRPLSKTLSTGEGHSFVTRIDNWFCNLQKRQATNRDRACRVQCMRALIKSIESTVSCLLEDQIDQTAEHPVELTTAEIINTAKSIYFNWYGINPNDQKFIAQNQCARLFHMLEVCLTIDVCSSHRRKHSNVVTLKLFTPIQKNASVVKLQCSAAEKHALNFLSVNYID